MSLSPLLRVPAIAGVLCAFALAGCGGDGSLKPAVSSPPGSATSSVSPSSESLETVDEPEVPSDVSVLTPSGRSLTVRDGITVTFVSAERYESKEVEKIIPGSYNVEKGSGPDVLPDQVAIKVTLSFVNSTPEPLKFDGQNIFMKGRFGSSQFDADTVYWAGDNTLAMDSVPNQVGPNSSTKVWATFKIPKADIASFTVTPFVDFSSSGAAFIDVGKAAK